MADNLKQIPGLPNYYLTSEGNAVKQEPSWWNKVKSYGKAALNVINEQAPYFIPGVSTYKFAEDAGNNFTTAYLQAKEGNLNAIGSIANGLGNTLMGVVSLIPFTGGGVKVATGLANDFNKALKAAKSQIVAKAFDNAVKNTTPKIVVPEGLVISYQPTTNTAKTSLAFLERPSKLTAVERLGIPKGDRGNLSLNLLQAINDLLDYINNGLYNQVFRVTPDWEDFGWNLSRDNLSFMQLFAKDKMTMNNRFWARVLLETPTGKGVVGWNPEANMASYSSRSFAIPETFNWAPGEAVMNIDGTNGHLIILTAPKTDFLSSMMDDEFKLIGLSLSPTIDKKIMKDFWINARKAQRPGTYLSGDNGRLPLGNDLIEAFKNKKLYKTPIYEKPLSEQFVLRTGLSPDSYSSIIRQGNRDNTLRWGEGFAKWNDSAITNKYIYDAFLNYKKGNISAEEYEKIFNDWSLNLGGRPLLWGVNSEGIKYPIHPHPYLYKRKQGGKLNYIKQ